MQLKQIDQNLYQILTTEEFIYDKGNGEQMYYQKQKEYQVHVLSDYSYSIESIATLDTVKEKIVERTIDNVDQDNVSTWLTSYYVRFIEALNVQGFDYVASYYDRQSEEFSEIESYIGYVQDREIRTENLDFQVVNVREHSDTEVAVDIYTEDRFFYPEGDGDTKKIQATYIIAISNNGDKKIRDLIDLSILEETEFNWREEE